MKGSRPHRSEGVVSVAGLVALSAVVAGCAGTRPAWPPDPEAWHVVESSSCEFSLRMPGAPTEREGTDRRGIRIHEYAALVSGQYLHTALCASADEPRSGDAAEAFVRARLDFERQAIEQRGWQLREGRLLHVGSCPAWQLVSVEGGIETSTRFIWAGERAFFLGAAGPAGDAATRRVADSMLDSLRSPRCEPGGATR